MAVYTHLADKQVKDFLVHYDVGLLTSFAGIEEGVENSNYKIETDKNKYILTIFEKRTPEKDLPFFFDFMTHLNQNKIACPYVLQDREGSRIRKIGDKSAALVSFLDGHNLHTKNVTSENCFEMGVLTARMHLAACDFGQTRKNSVSLPAWKNLFAKLDGKIEDDALYDLIAGEIHFIAENFKPDLPRSIVHADLFPDNVFVIDGKVQGVIDFYFSCEDYLAYDLAIVVNSWCFDADGKIVQPRFDKLLEGYQSIRALSDEERNMFPTMARAAALRILMTRLHDWVFQDADALVKPKDPQDYVSILKFHQAHDVFG